MSAAVQMTREPLISIRVLLIEGNPGDAHLFCRALSKATVGRFEVETADRLSVALARVAEGDVDVLVLDLSLPDSFGIETLERVRKVAPATPMVVLTDYDDERMGLEAVNKGAQDYLVKGDIGGHTIARALLFAIERRLFQEQLARRDDLLAEAQQIATLGSFDWDIVRDHLVGSEELYRIYGVDRARVDPTYRGFLALVHAEDRDRVHQLIQAALSAKAAFDFEYRIVRAGETLVLHSRGHVVVNGAGVPKRVAGVCQDITQRRKLEGAVLLASRMSSVGTLASGVAHEINNPLSYVTSNLEFIGQSLSELDNGPASGRVRELLELVSQARQGAERVRRIVQGLKAFSRADVVETRAPLELQSVLELAIHHTFDEIRHRARLVKDYGRAPYVEADEARLCQAFVNLLLNAAQAIGDGHVNGNEIRVVTSTDPEGRAVVEIRDTGCGIPEANRAQIFDPFFTSKPIGLGTGLGLSITHGIVTAHGGTITFGSPSAGKGTWFRVVLPRAPPEVHPPPVPVVPAAPPTASRRGSVLVVDDEPMVAMVLRRILMLDHDVAAAHNGREAMDRFDKGERFDVVLCDLMMPVMNGMILHAVLSKAIPEQAERIVFMTGGAFTPAAQLFLDLVPNPRVEKPFEATNIRALVRALVATSPRAGSANELRSP
jgi:PAS domain S-box-containing protein